MAKIVKYYCDCCGKDISGYSHEGELVTLKIVGSADSRCEPIKSELDMSTTIHFCYDCYNEKKKIIKSWTKK